MLSDGTGAATAAASSTNGGCWRTELIALGLEFRRIDPAQIAADGAVAMHAAAGLHRAIEIQVGQHMTVADVT